MEAGTGSDRRESTIMKTFEDMQKFGRDSLDASLKSFGACSKTAQAIAVEIADYSKKAFEEGAAATEKLYSAKSMEKAMEVQGDYFKTAYESLVSETAKLGELYADWEQEAYKPFEAYMSKTAAPAR
jgi:phasin family protein